MVKLHLNTEPTCGECNRWHKVSPEKQLAISNGNLKAPHQGECRGLPPQIAAIQIAPTGQIVNQALYPMLAEDNPCCALLVLDEPGDGT